MRPCPDWSLRSTRPCRRRPPRHCPPCRRSATGPVGRPRTPCASATGPSRLPTPARLAAPGAETVPRLVAALDSSVPQELAQALHTLSKIGDRRGWQAQDPRRIGHRLIAHPDTEVARSAWRCAVALVPGDDRGVLADVLVTQ